MLNPKRVALCVTCLVDQFMPEIGIASAKLLKRAGYAIEFPRGQTCCGQPFYNSGFRKQAVRLAKRMIRTFGSCERVVLPSGSCASMIRTEYPLLFAEEPDWERRASQLAQKTFELTEFLTRVAHWRPARLAQAPKITYHDSCHMCRHLHLRTEPRTLLEAAGYSLTDMAESDRCCGFGGLFCLRLPEVSNAMTAEKLKQAGWTDADVLVTADPGCLMQLRGLTDSQRGTEITGNAIRVEHVATLLEATT